MENTFEYVETPFDIFKAIVSENESNTSAGALANTRQIIDRIDVNIFEDEYAILYQVSKWCVKNSMPLKRQVLHQLLLNSRDELLQNHKVQISPDKSGEERIEDIIMHTMSEYDSLMEEEVDPTMLRGSMNLYIETWANQQMQKLIYDINLIHTEGMTVGNQHYVGREGANSYYNRKYEMIQSLVDERKDYLADDIDTITMSGLEIYNKIREDESNAEYVSKFGLNSLDDELLGLRRGEMVVVQAGSGIGKTRFTVGSIGYEALKMGKNVLHISLEQTPTKIQPLYQARHLVEQLGTRIGLTDSDIIKELYDPSLEGVIQESYVDLSENEEYGKLKIVGRDLKSGEIEKYLNTIYEEFPFDVVILDYFGLIGSERSETKYAELADAANKIKSMCKYFKGQGFLAVVPNQIQPETERQLLAGNITASKVGGAASQDLLRGSDITLTLNQTQEMEDEATMQILVDKVRSGESVPHMMADIDMGRCLFTEKVTEEEALV